MTSKLFRIAKWGGIIAAVLICLTVAAGLILRLLEPRHEPEGRLYDIGGFRLHLDCRGTNGDLPTVVIEGGASVPTQMYYWLSQQLAPTVRVCRYDRAGLGFSESGGTPRDADTVAGELHTLLERAEVSPPYLLAGHSLGGPYIRVFADLYPDDVAGLVFLDASHPEQVERLGTPEIPTLLVQAAAVASDLGLIHLYSKWAGEADSDGLPERQARILYSFLTSGSGLRTAAAELDALPAILSRAGETVDFGERPVRVFTVGEMPREDLVFLGLDPDTTYRKWLKLQEEMTSLSSDGRQIVVPGNHTSIVTMEESAAVITNEILSVLDGLGIAATPGHLP